MGYSDNTKSIWEPPAVDSLLESYLSAKQIIKERASSSIEINKTVREKELFWEKSTPCYKCHINPAKEGLDFKHKYQVGQHWEYNAIVKTYEINTYHHFFCEACATKYKSRKKIIHILEIIANILVLPIILLFIFNLYIVAIILCCLLPLPYFFNYLNNNWAESPKLSR